MDYDSLITDFERYGTIPKNFRIWDKLHKRWFQGDPSAKSRSSQTDCLHFDGEIMFMGETYHDQNEDDAWKNDPNIKSSLDILQYLIAIQDTGLKDENGLAIFEGDILRDGSSLGYVSYDLTLGEYVLVDFYGSITYSSSFDKCAIVGNIFENYDLFEGGE